MTPVSILIVIDRARVGSRTRTDERTFSAESGRT